MRRSAERRKINVFETKCLRSVLGVSRMDRVMNEEARRRPGIEREHSSKVKPRVLIGGFKYGENGSMSTVRKEGC